MEEEKNIAKVITDGPYDILGRCNPCEKFKNMGLRHSLKHLESITNKIPFYPIEQQAKYADMVCMYNVNNPEMLITFLKPASPLGWNTTSVGNLAYIALYSNNKLASEYARELLKLYAKYKKGML